MGSVEPVLALVRQELAAKLDLPDLAFDLTPLWAHDGAGRSATFKNLVAGGVSVNEALVTSGLDGAGRVNGRAETGVNDVARRTSRA